MMLFRDDDVVAIKKVPSPTTLKNLGIISFSADTSDSKLYMVLHFLLNTEYL